MFNKVLIANRGEIAVQVVRTCRDMGIETVALYDASDRGSLHVRLADQCVELRSERGYLDQQEILRIARETGAGAIHPGYGFLAEEASFIAACEQAGIIFVGPPSATVAMLRNKLATLERVAAAGFAVPRFSAVSFGDYDTGRLGAEAERLGYPLVIKSCSGGRGRGTRLVRGPDRLEKAVCQARAEGQAVFGSREIYLEQAILPSRYVEVSMLGDRFGNLVCLGEHDGSLQRNDRKIIEESPAPYLAPEQRQSLLRAALAIGRLLECRGVCTLQFLLDQGGQFYFTEIKARIQIEHSLVEILTHVDLVREQLHLAAGERLRVQQRDIQPRGSAIQCQINAEDPWNCSLPSPGRLQLFRLPGGPGVRVDTYAYGGCEVPVRYDPLLAKLVVWDMDRESCIRRVQRALEDFAIGGVQTNLPLLQRVVEDQDFVRGVYTTEFCQRPLLTTSASEHELRDLAVAAALAYVVRTQSFRPTTPERLRSGWHQDSRRLPS
jgi:acetyl-CoA carboxylase, biotin carboxylase subunit